MKKILFLLALFATPLFALEEEELVFDEEGPSATEFNNYLQEALADKDWWSVVDYADILAYHFPSSPFVQETAYLMGYAFFQMGQYEHANESLSAYLTHSSQHAHFEEALQMKFAIAEAFHNGKRKKLFGSHKMPAWLPAKEDAIAIYDEVISTVPHSELAAKSLLAKADILAELEDYKTSIETLTQLIRRFPKDEAAAEGYLQINKVYLLQCKNTSLDLDLLDLSSVNLRKFKLAFPREPRLEEAERIFSETEELFAANLYETGRFFERTGKKPASEIYYNKVVSKYPATKAAIAAREKLGVKDQESAL